ncbi:MAG: MraY family glycosyltransferase [bacterium]
MHFEVLANLLLPTFAAMALAFLFTGKIRKYCLAKNIVDDPKSAERKTHKVPTPLLGGVAIIISIAVVLAGVYRFAPVLIHPNILAMLPWIALAGFIILVGGVLDDIFALPAKVQIMFPVIACFVVVFGGDLEITKITNPFGGFIEIGLSKIIAFAWLMMMTYTTKLLDGLDGLATGITAIGAFMIGLLSLTVIYFEPSVAMLALIFFGALVGFLAWNFNPAQIYLGEAGSEFVGFFLGVLAIIGGSKIATALLVVGIPMLDVVSVMWRRFREGKPVFGGDRKHLHFQLAERFGVRKTVWILYALSASFGLVTLSLQSRVKFLALIAVAITAAILMNFSNKKDPQA